MLATPEGLDCLEIIADHYLDCPAQKLEELQRLGEVFSIIPHGLAQSLGTDAPLDATYLHKVARLVESVQAPWYTEHLAFTGVPGRPIGHFAALPFTRDAIRAVGRCVAQWQDAIGVPLLLENIAYLVSCPGEMSEVQFIAEVLEETDCGLLLDLHNLHANSINHHYDPLKFLDSLPVHRIQEVHVAGGRDEYGYRLDTHDGPVPEEVWELLRWVAARCLVSAVVLEWDTNLPTFEVMRSQLERARAILPGALVGTA